MPALLSFLSRNAAPNTKRIPDIDPSPDRWDNRRETDYQLRTIPRIASAHQKIGKRIPTLTRIIFNDYPLNQPTVVALLMWRLRTTERNPLRTHAYVPVRAAGNIGIFFQHSAASQLGKLLTLTAPHFLPSSILRWMFLASNAWLSPSLIGSAVLSSSTLTSLFDRSRTSHSIVSKNKQ